MTAAVGLAIATVGAGALPAQVLRPVGPPIQAVGTGCYDSVRQRYVLVDSAWRTWEEGGQGWSVRPADAPLADRWDLVFAAARREALGVVPDAMQQQLTAWAYDGASWRLLPATNAPTARQDAAIAWDAGRQQLVLFGGQESLTGMASDETWTFDGQTWTPHPTAVRPGARSGAAMAYDSARQRVVMFGGLQRTTGVLQDTWEWDGMAWSPRTPALAPSARHQAAMTYDPRRGRAVLYGGIGGIPAVSSELWEYDGSNWTQRTPAGPSPSGRIRPTPVFDTTSGEAALFSGAELSGNSAVQATSRWLWNGTRWATAGGFAAAPSPRIGANLLAEPGLAGTVLFGGAVQAGVLGDTWRWDGRAWTELPASGPSARAHGATCTTPGGALLFGGAGGLHAIQYFGDTWRWQGNAWSPVPHPSGPSPRANTSMAFDAARNRVVLFGGYDTTVFGDTWTFDGVQWQAATPPVAPPARFGHGTAYDPVRGRVVLVGGIDAQFLPLADTWEWDGSTWALRPLGNAPTGTGYCSLQYDPGRPGLVLVGGPTLLGGPASAWTLQGNSWVPLPQSPVRAYPYGTQMAVAPGGRGVLLAMDGQLHQLSSAAAGVAEFGAACGSNPPRLSARTWPVPGAAFGLDCSGGDPSAPVAFVGGFATGATPVGPCSLLVAAGAATALVAANAGGFAHLPLALPLNPALLGTAVYFQAAALQSQSASGFALSRGLAVTIGD